MEKTTLERRAIVTMAIARRPERRPDCTCIRDPYTDEIATYDNRCPIHGNPDPYFDNPKVIKYDNDWSLDSAEAEMHCKEPGDIWIGRRTSERFTSHGLWSDGHVHITGTVLRKPPYDEE